MTDWKSASVSGGRVRLDRAAISMLLVSLAAMVSLAVMTRWGIGTSPDSVQYIRTARQLVGESTGAPGSGWDLPALTQFPPLYPFVLAAGAFLDIDPLDAARWLNILLFGLNAFLVGFVIDRCCRNAPWLWIVGALLVVGASPLLVVHATALTEPLFLLLSLLGFHLLAVYFEEGKYARLLLAAVAMGLTFLARYAGVACILTGIVAILIAGSGGLSRRLRDAVAFGLVGVLPMGLWMVRNLVIAGAPTNRVFLVHPIGKSHLWQAFFTVSSWVHVPSSASNLFHLAVWLGLIGGVTVIVIGGQRTQAAESAAPPDAADRRRWSLGVVLGVFLAVYSAFLAASLSFFDANTPLDDRILSPVFVAGLLLLLLLTDRAWPFLRQRPVVRAIALATMVGLTAAHLVKGADLVAAAYREGWGFSRLSWRRSPTLAKVRAMPDGIRVYSNAPEIVYLHSGRMAQTIPRKWLPMNRQPNERFRAEMEELALTLRREPAIVVYFRNLTQTSMPSEHELAEQLGLKVLAQDADGSILGVVQPTP